MMIRDAYRETASLRRQVARLAAAYPDPATRPPAVAEHFNASSRALHMAELTLKAMRQAAHIRSRLAAEGRQLRAARAARRQSHTS